MAGPSVSAESMATPSTAVITELAEIPRFTPGRIQDVIHAIRSIAQQLSDEDRTFLIQAFSDMGTSVDELTEIVASEYRRSA